MIIGAPPMMANITHGLDPRPPEVLMGVSAPERTSCGSSAVGVRDGEGEGEGEGEGVGCSPASELFEPAAAAVHCDCSMHGAEHVAGVLCRLRLRWARFIAGACSGALLIASSPAGILSW